MKLAIVTATAGADSLSEAVRSWGGQVPIFIEDGADGMLPAYQRGFEAAKEYDILAFIHDDCLIHSPNWLARVLLEFEDPQVGLLGFGGALGHGSPELYKTPFDYHQLGRSDFLSNMRDAEVHGKRFTGSCSVAVLDGFAMIFRRSVLKEIGGWHPDSPAQYIAYDYAACCRVRRAGYTIRLVGLDCEHLGGRTYVKLGIGDKPDHWQKFLDAHEYVAKEFKDVLPFRVSP